MRRKLVLLIGMAILTSTFAGCSTFKKNKCDSCPGFGRNKH